MDSHESRSFSGLAFIVIAVACGGLTWLCVRWFGAQDPLTAAIAVILVELFIACFAMIGVLIAERISATYLSYEKSVLNKPIEPRRLWLWRPLWEPRVRYVRSAPPVGRRNTRPAESGAIRFPPHSDDASIVFDDWQPRRRAA
ncbi:MAG: hypothetical protein KDA93_25450 [Planctomycetaceae bacterium]|nr:hypothetical protein [Planctomycetaceae bacterium]